MISTTLAWLKENILAVDVVSVSVASDQITVITVNSTFVAAIVNILEVFNPTPAPSSNAEPRGGSTDARLWGG